VYALNLAAKELAAQEPRTPPLATPRHRKVLRFSRKAHDANSSGLLDDLDDEDEDDDEDSHVAHFEDTGEVPVATKASPPASFEFGTLKTVVDVVRVAS
jgi:hypothetical protein